MLTIPLADAVSGGSNAALITFGIYTLAVFGLAWASNRLLKSKSFLGEYFLGSRSLGVWAFALTFAATSSSGGSFTGFPSKIYVHGWSLALWIGSYMVVPICTMGLLGKRINQVARKTGAITIPDVIRDRFESTSLGMIATSLIVFFMAFNLVAQFKAGSLILRTLLADVPAFDAAVGMMGSAMANVPALATTEPSYLLCLMAFALAVIVYTTYGGFHAVVWTDVMQGVVMVGGVVFMLPLALWLVGGLPKATEQLGKMTPPRIGEAQITIDHASDVAELIPQGTWIVVDGGAEEPTRVFRTGLTTTIEAGAMSTAEPIRVLELTAAAQIAEISRQVSEGEGSRYGVALESAELRDYAYGANSEGVYTRAPGPHESSPNGFLPLSLAVSFFFMWAISGAGQPSNMVRLMAFNSAATLRRAIFTVSIYYTAIYFPLVVIFCCGRILLPGMELEADRIMPAMAVYLTNAAGWPWLAGLLVAAPFAAVMSTVDSFLLMISSAVVRDIYQRTIRPDAEERVIRRMSYTATFVVGFAAFLGAVFPPRFLQDIIVYTGSGLAACFLAPVTTGLYWRRVNAVGATAGMLGGFGMHLCLYAVGYWVYDQFQPLTPLGIDPILWGLMASFGTTFVVSHLTTAPPEHLVKRYFHQAESGA